MDFLYGINLPKTKSLVFDVGSMYLKSGFAGDSSPRHICRWEIWKHYTRNPKLEVNEWVDILSPIFTSICYKYLQTKPKDRNVIISEDFMSVTSFRYAIGKIFFEQLKVATLSFVPSASVAVVASGHHTALVIDCGWQMTRILPVYHDLMLTHAYQYVPKASLFVCNKIQERLEIENLDMSTLEDILVRTCFVKPLNDNLYDVPSISYESNVEKTINISSEIRKDSVSYLFEDFDGGNSVAEAVLESLLQCSILLRASLLHNMLVIGGTSMIPGFKSRLLEQMRWNTVNNPRYSSLCVLLESSSLARFVPCPFPCNLMSWVGGSLLGNLDVAPKTQITAEEYKEDNCRIRDFSYLGELAKLQE